MKYLACGLEMAAPVFSLRSFLHRNLAELRPKNND